MFRILLFIGITSSIFWLYNFGKKNGFSIVEIIQKFFSDFKNSIKNIAEFKKKILSEKIFIIKNILFLLTTSLFLVLAISAFIPSLIIGGNLTGIFLLIHATAAPFFALSLALVIILYSHQNKFEGKDLQNKIELSNLKSVKLNKIGYQKLIFWLFTFFSLPTIISIIISMFPIFGTEGQNILLEIHRYSALVLFILLVLLIGLLKSKSN
ncbi:MAG: hypothetical protein IPM32_13335 [Ignavibacteriae bacterium]|nr:hypothetical protein [Ignavibacteriota bacterium]